MATCLWAIGCLDDDTTIQSGEIDPVPRRGAGIAKTDQEFTLDPKALMAGENDDRTDDVSQRGARQGGEVVAGYDDQAHRVERCIRGDVRE